MSLVGLRQRARQSKPKLYTNLDDRVAQGIILGCIETILLLEPCDVAVPTFDTICIHAEIAGDVTLGE